MEATQEALSLALVCEEVTDPSMTSGRLGLTAETYHPQAIHGSATEHVLDYIKMQRYELIWLEVPRSKRSVHPGRLAAT